MILNNIKTKRNGKKSGFTIVELLVVIVVIGILAAITIVSYTGITAKAKLTKAQSNAASIASVLDTYAAETGAYPTTSANASNGSYAKIPTGLTLQSGPTTAVDNFQYSICTASVTAPTGARITYWDSTLATPGPTSTPMLVGSCTSGYTGA